MGGDTYVVYRGDEVIAVGTLEEVAERLGIQERSVRFMASHAAHRRERRSKRPRLVAERVRGIQHE